MSLWEPKPIYATLSRKSGQKRILQTTSEESGQTGSTHSAQGIDFGSPRQDPAALLPQLVAKVPPATKMPQPVAQIPLPWSISWSRQRRINKPIGVSEYELTRALPRELQSSLPSIESIEAELAETKPKKLPSKGTRNKKGG